eukprot:scaffold182891_cov19-Tisochrysis_lutea.AAC.1
MRVLGVLGVKCEGVDVAGQQATNREGPVGASAPFPRASVVRRHAAFVQAFRVFALRRRPFAWPLAHLTLLAALRTRAPARTHCRRWGLRRRSRAAAAWSP